ncbi:class I SAM-dependent methyltransferase [Singulisphaera sp. PoT]|uniref:class I SAM-dependent methyltransferase n=1 Tax=Singulisphaera sp. PoT TaxID=3411797 RepID=UPI003BF539F7
MNAESIDYLSALEGYALWASSYDDDGNPLIAIEGPAVADLFGPIAGKAVLDLGCGTGRHTLALAEAGADVTAADQSPEMLEKARQKLASHPVTWVRHALPAPLPFADGSFELVVLGLVTEHIADLDGLYLELARILRPGGRTIISSLHPDRTAEGHRARFIDKETGERRPILGYHRTVEDYNIAGDKAGLELEGERTLIVTPDVGDRFPRAVPYIGQALGWVGVWSKPKVA